MAKARGSGSSSKSMSSRTDSSFWKEHASATRPGNSLSTCSTTRCAGQDSTSAGRLCCCSGAGEADTFADAAPSSLRDWLAAKEHLLQGVAAQAEPQRLEWDDLVGRDVAEVDVRAEVLHEPRLTLLGRRLPDQALERNGVLDLVDETRAELAARPVDAGGAALAALGDHAPGARVELLAHPLRPQVRRDVHLGVLRAHLGEDDEVAREVGDQFELALARDLDRSVGDLDVREAVMLEPGLELVHPVARVHRLEEGAAADDRRVEVPVERDLLLEVVRDIARAPAELDDVHVCPGGVEEPLDLPQVQALVDDVGQARFARLARPRGYP